MRLEKFLPSLLPTLTRDQILEDCRITKQELTSTTAPAYRASESLFRTWTIKSDVIKNYTDVLRRNVRSPMQKNIVLTISHYLPVIADNLDQAIALVEETYNEDVIASGLSYKKAQLLQFVEALSFTVSYARRFLGLVYYCETAEHDETQVVTENLSRAEIDYLHVNFVPFCQAFSVCIGEPSDIRKQIAEIPEIVITPDNVRTTEQTIGLAKLDPLKMGFIAVWLNPIYHIRMLAAEWQHERYKAAGEELKRVQLQKLNLEKLAAGKPDANLQKQIDYAQKRIDGLRYDIAEMEKQ